MSASISKLGIYWYIHYQIAVFCGKEGKNLGIQLMNESKNVS